ncbi:response regulator transcription factor [Tetragenococcus halophilus]|uniref:OmpR family two-component response regulator n=2 Tax=Tetragenococcus halophilus TaxID=51669 RepID=A0A2H6DKP9_TETHA|nr:response regulator transcription factor [Tetragenococcus halophilus]AOF48530.1 PhoB family transcriptional regulator [Tetragenococcus halophilus]MCO7027092.1 response regulator transcription factor [Tetragenococcus halophilus]MCO8284631.1 response regulator transcription factor [Tetragenococcus halophilus]MCO8294282.1 response regulator transcription factor [Tetragenococcus halophilus]MCO8297757.1 response regulator transcription factor [Tetragenococcus halophilus]
MEPLNLLLVEDEESLASFIQSELQFEGYKTSWEKNGEAALDTFLQYKEQFDLILLDWMLPGLDGITIARRIRKVSKIPIIMMTARTQTTDIVTGLDTGLDDYITKPFEIEELFARIRVIERRLQVQNEESNLLHYKKITMDVAKHQVQVKDELIELTPKEFGILYQLMKEPEVVKKRDDLLNEVWGYDYFGQINVVDVYIRTLRNKLKEVDADSFVQTIRGVGYVLRDPYES